MYWSLEWGGNLNDRGDGIAIDSNDELYIVGSTQSFGAGSSDICLIKFDNDGNLIWNKTWGNTENNGGIDLSVDSNDNIYVSGWTYSGTNMMLLLKYNSTGHLQWAKTSSIGSWGMDVATDSNTGDIYLLGDDNNNIYLIKYNSTGDEQWSRTWNSGSQDGARGLALDSYGSIYITGYTQKPLKGDDILLIKYDPSGNEIWNRTWGEILSDRGQNLYVDSSDDIYLTGFFEDPDGIKSFDMCILKYNNTGDLQWDVSWGGNLTDYGFGIILDNLDNIYVSGITQSFEDIEGDQFLLKIGNLNPKPFTLTADADIPDLDGSFNLTWTDSLGANNYSLYSYNAYITKINHSLRLLANQNVIPPFLISGLSNGDYYYIVVAYNIYDKRMSNCILVQVQKRLIPAFNLIYLIGVISLVTTILVIKQKKKYFKEKIEF
ncbi:MAG: hypothetical protein ACFFD7_02070 [Candidatus Thorarchaeota archaeon]